MAVAWAGLYREFGVSDAPTLFGVSDAPTLEIGASATVVAILGVLLFLPARSRWIAISQRVVLFLLVPTSALVALYLAVGFADGVELEAVLVLALSLVILLSSLLCRPWRRGIASVT